MARVRARYCRAADDCSRRSAHKTMGPTRPICSSESPPKDKSMFQSRPEQVRIFRCVFNNRQDPTLSVGTLYTLWDAVIVAISNNQAQCRLDALDDSGDLHVVNSHCHFDHCGGGKHFLEVCTLYPYQGIGGPRQLPAVRASRLFGPSRTHAASRCERPSARAPRSARCWRRNKRKRGEYKDPTLAPQ